MSIPETYDPYFFKETNAGPTAVRNQHYVPRMHLKRFATNGMLQVTDLSNGRSSATGVKNAACEDYFYDWRSESEQLSTEDWFARHVETPAAPVLTRLCDHPDRIVSLTESEEQHIARFVAAQRLRVPAYRNHVATKRTKAIEWMAELVGNALKRPVAPDEVYKYFADMPDKIPWLNDLRRFQPMEAVTADLGEIDGDANMLRAMPWRLGRAMGFPFYTSDNPVSPHVPPVLPDFWDEFEDVVHYFPLSTQVLLVLGPVPQDITLKGSRRFKDYSRWETSFARHVISRSATRYLFGPRPHLDRSVAETALTRITRLIRELAIQWDGYNPSKPQPVPKEIIKVTPVGWPSISRLMTSASE